MKKLFIILLFVAISSLVFSGCALLDWIGPLTPVDPVSFLEADVNAVLVLDAVDPEEDFTYAIAWSIENIGTLDILKYVLTFDVYYPMLLKDNIILEVIGYDLEVDEKYEDLLILVPYGVAPLDIPETVSVSYKLFD